MLLSEGLSIAVAINAGAFLFNVGVTYAQFQRMRKDMVSFQVKLDKVQEWGHQKVEEFEGRISAMEGQRIS